MVEASDVGRAELDLLSWGPHRAGAARTGARTPSHDLPAPRVAPSSTFSTPYARLVFRLEAWRGTHGPWGGSARPTCRLPSPAAQTPQPWGQPPVISPPICHFQRPCCLHWLSLTHTCPRCRPPPCHRGQQKAQRWLWGQPAGTGQLGCQPASLSAT